MTQATQMTQIDRASLSANEERDKLISFPPPAFDMTLLAKDTGNVKGFRATTRVAPTMPRPSMVGATLVVALQACPHPEALLYRG